MADNCLRTPGTGETILADEVTDATLGTGKAQFVKLMSGALDSSEKIEGTAAYGLEVDVVRIPALVAGSAAIGKLAANSGVDIGDVDVLSMPALTVGNMIQWSHYSNAYTSAQTSADLVAASGATKIYIGRITIVSYYNTSNAGRTDVRVYLHTSTVGNTEQHVARVVFAPVPATGIEQYGGITIGNGAAPFIISAASDALKITTTTSGTHCGVQVMVDYIQV